jgi:hypothetical protein
VVSSTSQPSINVVSSCWVVKPASVHLVFIVVVSRGWKINQLDINNIFLNRILQEEVYTDKPPKFTHLTLVSHVCCLYRSLYGLKHDPWA